MAIKLGTTKGYGINKGVTVLVYGRPGVGKTTLCATAPNPIILSAESGLLSLDDYDIPTLTISNIEDLSDAYEYLTTNPEGMVYETICLDSVSEIAEQILAEEKGNTKDGRKAYGEMQDRMNKILRMFRDIEGKNVYFSAKMEKIQTDTGALIYAPSMPGTKLGQGIGYFLDEVFALGVMTDTETGERRRVLQTGANESYEAKDRSGKLDFIEPADLGYIIRKIKGESI